MIENWSIGEAYKQCISNERDQRQCDLIVTQWLQEENRCTEQAFQKVSASSVNAIAISQEYWQCCRKAKETAATKFLSTFNAG